MAYISTIATSLQDHLYRAKSPWDVLQLRVAELKQTDDPQDFQQAETLQAFQRLSQNNIVREVFDSMLASIYQGIEKEFPMVTFSLFSRLKSIIRFMEKAETLAAENTNRPENERLDNPFSRLTDPLAMRCVVDGGIETLYEVANFLIEFLYAEYQISPCLAAPLRDAQSYSRNDETSNYVKTMLGENAQYSYYRAVPKEIDSTSSDFDPRMFPMVTIPKKSGIKPEYQRFFKDYVVSPKDNLYQSLHCVFVLPVPGNTPIYFEVQLRTTEMDAYAELSFNANHGALRELQNAKIPHVDIDFSKVSIEGIIVTYNNEAPYLDNHHLFDSLMISQRSKTTR
jgi:hypothetical protein